MPSQYLTVMPVRAPVQRASFDLHQTIAESIQASGERLQDGDVLAVSSKYTAISEGRCAAASVDEALMGRTDLPKLKLF